MLSFKRISALFIALVIIAALSPAAFAATSGADASIQFTQEEQAFIQSCGTIRVGLNMTRPPFAEYDEKTGTFTGINVDIMDEISRISGLTFEYVPMTAGVKVPDLLAGGDYDVLCGIERDNFANSDTIVATKAFLESAIVPVGRAGENVDLNSNITVTFPSSFQALQKLLEAEYPNMKIEPYETNRDCLDAVVDGRADVFIQNTHLLSRLLQEPKYENLDILPVEIMTEHTALAMLKTEDPRLASILNKSIDGLSQAVISGSLIENTFATRYKMSFGDMVYKFRLQISVAAILILACFILLLRLAAVRRRSEHTLQIKNEQLSLAICQAEQASATKSQFLARMSHEIRTPMNAIIGLTTIAKTNIDNKVKVEDSLSKIDMSSRILLNLINDILDMSAIENQKLKIAHQPFNLKELVNSITAVYYTQCAQKGVDFDLNCAGISEEQLIGDPLRVNQILLNLISNAYKFTNPGGRISIQMTQTVQRDNTIFLRIVVADTGIGMSEDMQKRLFHRFEQENATTAQLHGGSGLGMSIAKSLIELMHGSIKVESELGKGTTFTVDIPFELDPNTVNADYKKLKNIRALIVDDSNEAREYTAIVLDRIGVSYDIASSGTEAISMLEKAYANRSGYDICFLDWKMPEMSGIELTRQIRERFDADTVIIIVSSYDLSEIEEEAQKAGVNHVVAKPLFQSTVFNLLMQLSGGQYVKPTAGQEKYDFTGKRVLLAEDNALNSEIAIELLGMVNMAVDHAEDGQAAVELFEKSAPGTYDGILMDIQMPILNGYEAARKIRKSTHPQAKTIPIWAMTADAFNEDVASALSAGMSGHIAKPIDTEILYKTMQQAFNQL